MSSLNDQSSVKADQSQRFYSMDPAQTSDKIGNLAALGKAVCLNARTRHQDKSVHTTAEIAAVVVALLPRQQDGAVDNTGTPEYIVVATLPLRISEIRNKQRANSYEVFQNLVRYKVFDVNLHGELLEPCYEKRDRTGAVTAGTIKLYQLYAQGTFVGRFRRENGREVAHNHALFLGMYIGKWLAEHAILACNVGEFEGDETSDGEEHIDQARAKALADEQHPWAKEFSETLMETEEEGREAAYKKIVEKVEGGELDPANIRAADREEVLLPNGWDVEFDGFGFLPDKAMAGLNERRRRHKRHLD